ncbi:MAG: hypothetical protein M3237_12135 [Actinomycetota bacterium]|nr:hypothetical protein [Actinomycetota bacterium]
MILSHVRRLGVLTVAGALTIAGATVVTTGTAHAAADDTSAQWLAKQARTGLVHNDQYDFDDYGLTADVGIALDRIGGQRATVTKIRTKLARNVKSWTTGADFGTSDVYAGSTAKAVVLAQATGANPRTFGGVNLVRQLSKRISTTAPNVGRLQDKAETDFANTIGQALAVQGLSKARDGKADEAVRFLLKQQCSAGYFRLIFAPTTAAAQGCDAGSRAQSAPDPDATAVALTSLQSLARPTAKVRRAMVKGAAWLARQQKANGSFRGGPSTPTSNSNSTGLAAIALAEAGKCAVARKAARWVAKLQVMGNVAGTPLAGEKGAIAYDLSALRRGRESGITVETRDQWRRATTQAAPALGLLSASGCR